MSDQLKVTAAPSGAEDMAELTQLMVLRLAVEEFLIDEAALLDDWQLDSWLELFAEDCRYVVPATDTPDGNPDTTLMLIDDDRMRLEGRVRRLKSRHAHREFPWSRTRRLVSNVRLVEVNSNEIRVEASVVVHRFRHEQRDLFVAHYRHTLIRDGQAFRFRERRAELDFERLSPNGALSMIL
jgi:p-cumate 2,3-dioxygenase subunit beta